MCGKSTCQLQIIKQIVETSADKIPNDVSKQQLTTLITKLQLTIKAAAAVPMAFKVNTMTTQTRASSKMLLFSLGLAILLSWASGELQRADYCETKNCQAPACRCSGLKLPKSDFRGKETQIPQFVTVTFDDGVNYVNYDQYETLFKDLTNPDGCTVSATFFVSHDYTDYVRVNMLYNEGHEIALHSVTHKTDQQYWREASVDLMKREFGNMIDIVETFAKVDRKDIHGMRLPFLQMNGNASYQAAKEIGLLYESSWAASPLVKAPLWPYTLDYLSAQQCLSGPCPTASIPGLWVYPMTSWRDRQNFTCAMLDACVFDIDDDEEDIFDWMLDNFLTHYEQNRAPFGMFLHSSWFHRAKHHLPAMRRFLEYLTTLPDVYITNIKQVIDYMQKPVLGKVKTCTSKPEVACFPKTCVLTKGKSSTRYMRVCDECPDAYPWLDNPLGKPELVKDMPSSSEEEKERKQKAKELKKQNKKARPSRRFGPRREEDDDKPRPRARIQARTERRRHHSEEEVKETRKNKSVEEKVVQSKRSRHNNESKKDESVEEVKSRKDKDAEEEKPKSKSRARIIENDDY